MREAEGQMDIEVWLCNSIPWCEKQFWPKVAEKKRSKFINVLMVLQLGSFKSFILSRSLFCLPLMFMILLCLSFRISFFSIFSFYFCLISFPQSIWHLRKMNHFMIFLLVAKKTYPNCDLLLVSHYLLILFSISLELSTVFSGFFSLFRCNFFRFNFLFLSFMWRLKSNMREHETLNPISNTVHP